MKSIKELSEKITPSKNLPETMEAVQKQIYSEIKKNIKELKNSHYIIVMDLCSSSVILEKLQAAEKINVWRDFWKSIFNHMIRNPYFSFRCKPYKFVGDGFIIMLRKDFSDDVLEFMQKLNDFSCQELKKILEKYNIQPKRFGFAYGIDRGEIIPMQLLGQMEFMGEAINAATRLQSQLKAPEDACSVMVSENVYKEIKIPQGTKQVEKKCVLRNLYDDNEITCHQIWL